MSISTDADVASPVSAGGAGVGPDDILVPQAVIGWLRAIASGLAILAVGLGVGIGFTNWLLTDGSLSSLSRDDRMGLATSLFLISVIVIAWGVRRLQARRLI